MADTKIKVTIESDGKTTVLDARKGRALKELVFSASFGKTLPCGGLGRCGKCVVTFKSGAPRPNSFDTRFLSEKELSTGQRILCKCLVFEDCHVLLDDANKDMYIETVDDTSFAKEKEYTNYGIAIDIGTTTIAAALVGMDGSTKEVDVPGASSCANSQARYGSDVISRISAAEDSKIREELRRLVTCDISAIINDLLNNINDTNTSLKLICITGNTAMLHLLMGRDVSPLGKYPYEAGDISFAEYDYKKVFGTDFGSDGLWNVKVVLFPGISAFIGSDIVSGIYYLQSELHIEGDNKKRLLVDLGTNGEMAFWDGKGIRCASTAAGPVFEGGGIQSGCASVKGAISHVSIKDSSFDTRIETIGGGKPVGICGTGVLEAVSEMARSGVISREGLLRDEYFDRGFPIYKEGGIFMTQKDVRNVQLAKAAILSGIKEIVRDEKVDEIYISGGFGSGIDLSNIKSLRLFPDDFLPKARAIGNSSLKGAIVFISKVFEMCNRGDKLETAIEAQHIRLSQIVASSNELILANKENFGENFVEQLNF